IALYRECGDEHGEAWSLHSLGTIYRQIDRLDQTMTCYQQALHIRQELHVSLDEKAETLAELGDICYQTGRPNEAECNWREALAYYNVIRSEHAQMRVKQLRNALVAMGAEP
ncbi:MAG: tetratricopeptide repeat protein, partial [Pseudonocardiaceae bacterium]|nr:tetratricopeptide repeat protein [Pseudonocardiaceae bacterium]